MHTIRGEGELQPHIRGDELDDDAMLIFQIERGTASSNGDTGARRDIGSRILHACIFPLRTCNGFKPCIGGFLSPQPMFQPADSSGSLVVSRIDSSSSTIATS